MTDLFKISAFLLSVFIASFISLASQETVRAAPDEPNQSNGTPPVSTTDELDRPIADPLASKGVVAATVLGKPIYLKWIEPSAAELERLEKSERSPLSRKAETLLAKVAGAIMMDYYQREELHPTKDEIGAKFSAGLRADPDLMAKLILNQQSRLKTLSPLAFGIASSIDWVVTKHLHEKYGGSVAVSSFGGMMSIEGRNELIRQYVASGDVQFHHPELERALWEQAEKKYALDVTVRDQKRIKQKFETPPWEHYIARLKKMSTEQAPARNASTSDRILTLCQFPFSDDPQWVICEAEVSSLDDIKELGSDACKANTMIETHPAAQKDVAYKRARALMQARKLPLYLLTIDKKGGPDTLEEFDDPKVQGDRD